MVGMLRLGFAIVYMLRTCINICKNIQNALCLCVGLGLCLRVFVGVYVHIFIVTNKIQSLPPSDMPLLLFLSKLFLCYCNPTRTRKPQDRPRHTYRHIVNIYITGYFEASAHSMVSNTVYTQMIAHSSVHM